MTKTIKGSLVDVGAERLPRWMRSPRTRHISLPERNGLVISFDREGAFTHAQCLQPAEISPSKGMTDRVIDVPINAIEAAELYVKATKSLEAHLGIPVAAIASFSRVTQEHSKPTDTFYWALVDLGSYRTVFEELVPASWDTINADQ